VRAALVSQIIAVGLAAYLLRSSLLSFRRWRAFQASAEPTKRERLYRNILARNGILVAAALTAADLEGLGLRRWFLEPVFLSSVGGALLISALLLIFTRRGRGLRDRLLRSLGDLTPRTRAERRLFTLVALQAGPVEEILYRGFLLAFLQWLGISSWPILVGASALLFGLGHWYQKLFGVFLTGLLGAIFAWMTLETGSLYMPILVHTMVDVRAIALLYSRREATS
jgi:membrane protease YdiL (CAAX protease family)